MAVKARRNMKKKNSKRLYSRIEGYFGWPVIYLALISIMAVAGVVYNKTLGMGFAGILTIGVVITAYLLLWTRKKVIKEIISFSMNLDSAQKELLMEFQVPYILLDSAGKIKWYNTEFEKLFTGIRLSNVKLANILPGTNSVIFPLENKRHEKNIIHESKNYRVVFNPVAFDETADDEFIEGKKSDTLYATYFFDITKETELSKKNTEQMAVFCLVYIDNFDDVIHGIEDVRRPLLIALIDRSINKFTKDIDGVVRKFEKDKYLIVFQHKHIDALMESKFPILDSIREISIGNEFPVTLSMGVGDSSGSYEKKLEYAKIAMDLALGRGGDQAVVKNDENLSFYGGSARAIEKNTRVKARIKAHAFRELIDEADRILIMGHKLGDMDSLGASIGIVACAKHFGKPAHIIMNKVTTAIASVYDRIIEDKDYPTDLFLNNQQANAFAGENTLLVIVDVNRPSYTEYPEIIRNIKKIVVFDHHRVTADSIDFAVLSYVEPYASSTCEMVTEIIQYVSEKVKLKPVEADALFAGITVDTKSFVTKTGVKTFEAAAFLRRNGADAIRVSKFFKNDMESYKAKAAAVKDAEIYKDNIAISVCPSEIKNSTLVGAQSADELLNIAGIRASFVLTEAEGIVYISARSVDEINVQLIMEKIGGGGHVSVAGAQLEGYTIENAMILLKQTIDDYFAKGDK